MRNRVCVGDVRCLKVFHHDKSRLPSGFLSEEDIAEGTLSDEGMLACESWTWHKSARRTRGKLAARTRKFDVIAITESWGNSNSDTVRVRD